MQDTEQTAGDTANDQTQRVPGQMEDMAGQPPEMTEEAEQADTAEASDQTQRVPGQMEEMAGQPPEMTEETEQTADAAEANDQTQKAPEQREEMSQRGEQGQRGGGPMGEMSRISWKDVAPTLAVCGGIFLLGFGYLVYFRRRRRLSMPKQEEKTDTTE